MALNVGLAPTVFWGPTGHAQGARRRLGAKSTGSIVGLVVAAAYVLATADRSGQGDGAVLGTFGFAILVAGSFGGWMFGPVAWRAQSDRAWVPVIIGLAVTTVVIGAFAVGLGMGADAASGIAEPGEALRVVASLVLVTVVFGVPLFGLFMLPVTLAASATWALVMAVLRP